MIEQYKDRSNDWVLPLLADMLLVHIEDVVKRRPGYEESLDWIFDDTGKYRIQFQDVCHLLGYSPRAVREKIKALLHGDRDMNTGHRKPPRG